MARGMLREGGVGDMFEGGAMRGARRCRPQDVFAAAVVPNVGASGGAPSEQS